MTWGMILIYLDTHWWAMGWPQTIEWGDAPEEKLGPGVYRLSWGGLD